MGFCFKFTIVAANNNDLNHVYLHFIEINTHEARKLNC